MSQLKYITDWLKSLGTQVSIDVRYRSEIIESLPWDDDYDAVAEELDEIARNDAREVNRTRVYTIVATNERGEKTPCPISLRHRVARESTAVSAQAVVDMAIKLVEASGKERDRMAKRLERIEERSDDMWALHDKLRREALESDMKKEKHDKLMEVLGRGADAGIPLMIAIANKLTGDKLAPMLGKPDMKVLALTEIIKALPENANELLPPLMSKDQWDLLSAIIEDGLYNRITPNHVVAFKKMVKEMPPEQLQALAAHLNVGQQAAMGTLFDESQN